MLIDLHAHSKAISRCSRITGKDNIDLSLEKGMDGFVITNHYDKNYVVNNDYLDLVNRYINEYYYVQFYKWMFPYSSKFLFLIIMEDAE